MSPPSRADAARAIDGRRPWFLISAPGCAGDLRGNMGNADYSYGFVLRAVAPLLEHFGPTEVVDRPESRLASRAAEARARGFRPLHVCLQPPHHAYLTPELPNIIFPFWEFPEIPSRPFLFDSRQDWRRILGRADLVLAACGFTAEAFRRSGIEATVAVVPVPLADRAFEIPDWAPDARVRIECRHVELGGAAPATPTTGPGEISTPPPARWKRAARGAYHRLKGDYKRLVVPWLSDRAKESLFQAKNRLLRKVPLEEPRPPLATLELGGLVFTSIFNLGDRRKNADDICTAFLRAFRDRPDATLVLKLATNPARERHELKELRHHYARWNLQHRCRIVVITDYLDDAQMSDLMRGTTYYLNASKAEGACLPVQEAMAGGRPAIAPRHTAFLDYLDESVALRIDSDPEPTFFPHDPEPRFETSWHRINWRSLHDRLLEGARIAVEDPPRYRSLSSRGRERMRAMYARPVATAAMARALGLLPERLEARGFSWSAGGDAA